MNAADAGAAFSPASSHCSCFWNGPPAPYTSRSVRSSTTKNRGERTGSA